MFHRVMTIFDKPDNFLQFWNLRNSHSTYSEIQALWLVEKWQQKSNFRFSPFGLGDATNVWACNSELLQISFSVSQSVPKNGTELEF